MIILYELINSKELRFSELNEVGGNTVFLVKLSRRNLTIPFVGEAGREPYNGYNNCERCSLITP